MASATTWTALKQWRVDTGLPEGLMADTDGDGTPSLLEHALGCAPSTPSAAALGINAGHLTLAFHRIAEPDLVYEVRAASDLGDWGPPPVWFSTCAQNVAGEVTVADPVALSNANRRFLHLRVLPRPATTLGDRWNVLVAGADISGVCAAFADLKTCPLPWRHGAREPGGLRGNSRRD